MCTFFVHTSRWRQSSWYMQLCTLQIGHSRLISSTRSPSTDSSRFIQISAVGSDANRSVSLQSSPLRIKYSVTDIYSHSGGHRQLYEAKVLSSRACVSQRLTVPSPRSRDPSEVGTRDCCVPPISGGKVNLEMSSQTPSQSFEYLSLPFRTDLRVVCPADHIL